MTEKKAKQVSTDRIEFDVHKAVITDLIHSQNGTLATAIRELIMNSLDAGAKSITISLDETSFCVLDDGKGFESKEDIETNFRVFGQPHETHDAIYGRFRIGRGQIMSFGEVTWASKRFSMHVDVQQQGMTFELTEHETEIESGCRVSGNLYRPIDAKEILTIAKAVRELVAYCHCNVVLNQKTIAPSNDDEQWDIDNERYRLRWKKSSDFRVYNQGVYVKTLSRYDAVVGGIVDTKQQLQLNMARNEVTSEDPLWQEIFQVISEKSFEQSVRATYTKKVSPEVRANLIENFIDGNLPEGTDLGQLPLFQDIRGHSLTLSQILRSGLPITVCPSDKTALGDMIATSRRAIVLRDQALAEWNQFLWDFGVHTLTDLLSLLEEIVEEYGCRTLGLRISEISPVQFEDAARGYDLYKNEIPTEKYSEKEKVAVAALLSASKSMARKLSDATNRHFQYRKIGLGTSDTANAWTDGYSRIWFDRRALKQLNKAGNKGGIALTAILLHEYLHEPDDEDSCHHPFEFYKIYHDLCGDERNILGSVANTLETVYINRLRGAEIPVPAALLAYHAPLVRKKKEKDARPWYARGDVEYVLFLTEEAEELSPLDNLVMKKLHAFKPRKGSSREWGFPRYTFTASDYMSVKDLYDHARSIDPSIPSEEYYFDRNRYGSSPEAEDKKKITGAAVLSSTYDKKYQTTPDFWRRMFDCETVPKVLQQLIDSPLSNIAVAGFENNKRRRVISARVDFNHNIVNRDQVLWGREHADLAVEDDAVLLGAIDLVKYAYTTLRKQEDRDRLAQALLSEKGKKRLEKAIAEDTNAPKSLY